MEYLCNIKFNNNKMDEIRENILDSKIVKYIESIYIIFLTSIYLDYTHFSTISLRDSLIQDNYSVALNEGKRIKRAYRSDDRVNEDEEEFSETKRFKKIELNDCNK